MPDRECGECRACCEIPIIEALDKPANTLCEHWCGNCTIYEERPKVCAGFNCLWLLGYVNHKPNECGLMAFASEATITIAEVWEGAIDTLLGHKYVLSVLSKYKECHVIRYGQEGRYTIRKKSK